jgi:hypothetical protein
MRKEPKSFTVEVKRRPGGAAKKPAPFLPVAEARPAPQPADAFFRATAPEPEAPAAPIRRILPCLVTEAAMETAQAEALSTAEPERRPRGRPRKPKNQDEPAPLAPRKRGRPRKNPVANVPVVRPAPVEAPVRVAQSPALVALTTSERATARRSAVVGLPRGERWKRRLPKAPR